MKLMKLTSTVGILESVAAITALNSSATSALATINGDDATPGSILKQFADNKAYSDTLVSGVDLSQIDANKQSLAVLNSDASVDGSLAKDLVEAIALADNTTTTLLVPVIDAASANTSAVNILNGDSSIVGSVNSAISAVVGAAPEQYDTLKEIGDKLIEVGSLHDSMDESIVADKAAIEASITSLTADAEEFRTASINTTIPNSLSAKEDELISAARSHVDSTTPMFFDSGKMFSELNGDVAKMDLLRQNIYLLGDADIETYYMGQKPLFRSEPILVDGNTIQLDARVQAKHVDSFTIEYPNGEYDVLAIVDNGDGNFDINDAAKGDLDGATILAKYAIDQSIVFNQG